MFLRPHQRSKDGKDHTCWSLVETVRTVDGPRQRTLCYLGELNGSAQARWLKSIEVFNEQGEAEQLKLFPSHIEVPDADPQVARVLVNRVRLERTRQFGGCFLGLELWRGLGLDGFFEQALETLGLDCTFRAFRLRDDVATYTCVPSNQYQTATMWMEPFGFSVASDATCRPTNNCLTRTSAREAIQKSPLELSISRPTAGHVEYGPRENKTVILTL
jgi:hypothetical protein